VRVTIALVVGVLGSGLVLNGRRPLGVALCLLALALAWTPGAA